MTDQDTDIKVPTQTETQAKTQINLTSVAILFIIAVAIAVGLIGVAKGTTSPWILIAPIVVGVYAILTIRQKN